jgi:excisionase family DNA binding protein
MSSSTKQASQSAEFTFLSVDEAAELLRVNRNSLYESVKRGEVPGVVKVGRTIRIRRAALLSGLSTP